VLAEVISGEFELCVLCGDAVDVDPARVNGVRTGLGNLDIERGLPKTPIISTPESSQMFRIAPSSTSDTPTLIYVLAMTGLATTTATMMPKAAIQNLLTMHLPSAHDSMRPAARPHLIWTWTTDGLLLEHRMRTTALATNMTPKRSSLPRPMMFSASNTGQASVTYYQMRDYTAIYCTAEYRSNPSRAVLCTTMLVESHPEWCIRPTRARGRAKRDAFSFGAPAHRWYVTQVKAW